nr:PREDICTED: uncharacterized protein LOC105670697 [Linepithema humile]XP_012219783.1 PREDICTED: uncharacterized protein LOC105670697 [Linepithema humile]
MPLSNITKKNVREYYTLLSNFEAQCNFCEKKYTYITINTLKHHIHSQHREIEKYEEERKRKKWPWMYFKYLNESYSQCIICDANVLSISVESKSVEKHLTDFHSEEEQENHTQKSWLEKYFAKSDDFSMKCNKCHKELSVAIQKINLTEHIKNSHPNKLKNTQETYDTVSPSKRISSLETDTSMSLNMATKQYLGQYYVKLSNFKAQCIFCKNEYKYLQYNNFENHIAARHEEISKYEYERKRKKWPWMYFTYLNKLCSKCIICNARLLSTSTERHLKEHTKQEQKNHKLRSWIRKYSTLKDDFVMECNICHDNITLTVSSKLNYHINNNHSDKLKNMQRTYDTVDSSESVSSLEKNTMSLKDC